MAGTSGTGGTGGSAATGLKVQYRIGDTDAADLVVKPYLKVFNTGTIPVALSTLTIRYWYTIDVPVDTERPQCDFASIGCNTVSLSNVTLSPARTNADRYFQVGFTPDAGNLASGANTGDIMVWFHKSAFGTYDETNDHSFDATKTSYADWTRVTLYENGNLVWGVEPSVLAAKVPM